MCNTCGHTPCSSSDDPPPELDPFVELPPEERVLLWDKETVTWKPEADWGELPPEDPWALRPGELAHAGGMTVQRQDVLNEEKLVLVQLYKQTALLECQVCDATFTLPNKEWRAWACARCDQEKLSVYSIKPYRPVGHAHQLAA